MITCVIIDDEQTGINILKKLVADYSPDLHVLRTFLSPIEAIPYILKHKPQVIFSDIEMDDINGIKLKQMLMEYKGILIYVTAHSHYAIEAIKARAFDYLLKPLKILEFVEVNNKIRHHYEIKDTRPKTITIHTSSSVQIVKQEDIIMIKGEGSYCHIHLKDQKTITTSKNIGHFEKILSTTMFFRSHQSYLVNIGFIQSISKVDGLEVLMVNDLKAALSRSKMKGLINKLSV